MLVAGRWSGTFALPNWIGHPQQSRLSLRKPGSRCRFGDHDYRGDAVGKGHNPALRYPHRIADRDALLYRLRACFVRSSDRRAAIGYVQTIPLRIRRPVRAGCCAIAGKHGLHGALSNGR